MTHRFRRRTKHRLRELGWQPGRQNAMDYEGPLREDGWDVAPAAIRFLKEFGGLSFPLRAFQVLGFDFGRVAWIAKLGLVRINPADREQCVPDAQAVLAKVQPCTPIGEVPDNEYILLMNRAGVVFGWMPTVEPAYSRLWQEARSGDELIEGYCGRHLRPRYL
jgi:hypothetical protein